MLFSFRHIADNCPPLLLGKLTSPRGVDAYLAFARAEVVALLTDHRAVVLAIADALMGHRTLSGEQIKTLIES
jgi:hypothetical protein